MNTPINHNKNKGLSFIAAVILGVSALFGLQACGGGGGSSNADASGLYKNGTAELNSAAISLNDMRAFVYDNRLIMFSISEHVLFDGQISNITGSDFTASVNLYETGVMTQANISVTGRVTSQSQITGTLAGNGVGSGSFTLTFDNAYNSGATVEKFRDKSKDWEGDLLTTFSAVGDVYILPDSVDTYDNNGIASVVGTFLNSNGTIFCSYIGVFTIPDSRYNMYAINNDIPSGLGSNNTYCSSQFLDPATEYTGFSAVLSESNTDNDIIYAVTNGEYSVFGLLTILP